MDIFAEALSRQTGSGLTGQAALAALYDAIPKGNVKSADILPIVAEIMRERAEPKIGALRKTSMAEQARLGNALQDWVNVFSETGGEEGFARIFRTLTNSVERLTPVIEASSRAFNWFSKQLEAPLLIVGDLGTHFENVQKTMNALHPDAMKFAAVGALIATRWGRLFGIFSGLFLILEDISVGVLGGDSYTKDFFDFLEKFVEFDKGIMGVAMAFLAVAAALKLVSAAGVGALGGGLGKSAGKGGAVSMGTGAKVLGALGVVGAVGAGGAYALDQIGFFERMEQYRLVHSDPAQRAEFMTGKSSGQWKGIDDYLAFQRDRRAAMEADVAAGIITPEQAMSQMGMTNNTTSNNITNTFEINIEGALDAESFNGVMQNQIMPQFEIFFNNQLQLVDTSFGSK